MNVFVTKIQSLSMIVAKSLDLFMHFSLIFFILAVCWLKLSVMIMYFQPK